MTIRGRVRKHKRLPHPVRQGGRIWACYDDGTEEELDPLAAKLYAENWFNAVAGGYVHERTKLPGGE